MSDNFPYRSLPVSKLSGQKPEWTPVSCLNGSEGLNRLEEHDAETKSDLLPLLRLNPCSHGCAYDYYPHRCH